MQFVLGVPFFSLWPSGNESHLHLRSLYFASQKQSLGARVLPAHGCPVRHLAVVLVLRLAQNREAVHMSLTQRAEFDIICPEALGFCVFTWVVKLRGAVWLQA